LASIYTSQFTGFHKVVLQLIGTPHSQVQSYRFFLTGAITPVKKYLQATVQRFCDAVNARFMMVRPNKTKPEGYMWPLDVPGMAPDVRIEYRITEAGLE
jgi:hypothetical protein